MKRIDLEDGGNIDDDIVIEDGEGGSFIPPSNVKVTPNQDRVLKIGRTLDTIAGYSREIDYLQYEYNQLRAQYQATSYVDEDKLKSIQKNVLQLTRWIKENKTTLDHLSFMLDEEKADKDSVITSIHNRVRIKSNDNIVAVSEEDLAIDEIEIQNVGTKNWFMRSVSVVISIPDYRGSEDEELESDPIEIRSLEMGDTLKIKDIVLKRKDDLSLINRGFYDAYLFVRDHNIGDLSIKKPITIQIT